MTFASGDLLHGDESGLVSIPPQVAEATVERARQVTEEEAEYFAFLDSDGFSMDELRRRIIPHE
jgi:regulator of RNase E activity RraA